MLDTGASHSFITRMLVTKLKLTTTRLDASLTATDFGGARATISEMVTTVISLANASRKWSFYVCAQAPAPVVLGLDVVLRWPLFLNPTNICLHFAAPSNDAALPTADRGCSPSNKASSDEGLQLYRSIASSDLFDHVLLFTFRAERSQNPSRRTSVLRRCRSTDRRS